MSSEIRRTKPSSSTSSVMAKNAALSATDFNPETFRMWMGFEEKAADANFGRSWKEYESRRHGATTTLPRRHLGD